jgi:hypothetical protein
MQTAPLSDSPPAPIHLEFIAFDDGIVTTDNGRSLRSMLYCSDVLIYVVQALNVDTIQKLRCEHNKLNRKEMFYNGDDDKGLGRMER